MITTGMLKRPVWMADHDEFDHIVKNLQRVLRLNDQCGDHLYVEEFTKECNAMFVYGIYLLRGGGRCKIIFRGYLETISERGFTKQRKQFLQENDKLYEGMELTTKNIRSSSKH